MPPPGGQKTASKATLWVKDGWIYIRTPFNADFIDDLKNDIPPRARKYLPVDKEWKVEAAYAEDVEKLVRKYFGEPTIVQNEVYVQGPAVSGDDPYARFLRACPTPVLAKLYKVAAIELHPDRGGDANAMAEVNAAWTEIKKDRGI
jgi:hypothetical protein